MQCSFVKANKVVREMESAGLLCTSGGEYPLLTLTERGALIMKNGGALQLHMPGVHAGLRPRAATRPEPEVELRELGFDESLFKKLRDLRTQVAERENVPAYVIFNNQTLEFLTRLRPTTMAAGLRIRGIAEKKAEKYLEPFLAVIRAHR